MTTNHDRQAACINAAQFTFTYDGADEPQLRTLTFEVTRGERVAVMGATGAGKTTLAMSLNGLVPHHHDGAVAGSLVVAGHDVASSEVTDLVRSVGLVMQDPEAQITGRTALDDATVGPANLGLPREVVLTRAEQALARVGLGELLHRDTSQMSGGQQQRLAIAGILAMEPEILVLDEPTSELDPAGTEQVFDVVRNVSDASAHTVVLIEHEPELVAAWADRLLVLAHGTIVYDGPPTGFFTHRELVAQAGLRQPGVNAVLSALVEQGLLPAQHGPTPTSVPEAVALLRPHLPHLQVTEPDQRPVPPPRPPVVEVRSLSHRYPSGVEALTDVSLTIGEGEFVALLGRNGAGKTTFARHLNGLLRPTSGEVHINNRPTAGRKLHELATEVGYVFQNPDHQIFASSVADEIAFGLKNLGSSEEEIKTRIREVLAQVGMSGMEDVHPYRLGKGQRQRLAVASVLALRPRILVIDEPTTGQDWSGSLAIMELVRDLNEHGNTIVMVTHDMLLASTYARRAVVFDGGRVCADRPIKDLFSDVALLDAAKLRPPQVTDLALTLGMGPLTSAEEFAAVWGGARVS